MPARSRRRTLRPTGASAAPVAAPPPPGRFVDQLATCATCGRSFVFTVEAQRRLADAGLPVEPPAQCPRCAPATAEAPPVVEPRPASADQRPLADDRPPSAERRPPVEDRPARREHRAPSRRDDERHASGGGRRPAAAEPPADLKTGEMFDIQYTVRSYGFVKWYDAERGYGFIVDDDDGREYFVHQSELQGVKTLYEGQAVEFELVRRPKGVEAALVIPI